MTTEFTLVTLIGIFILGAALKNYWLLWFFAGVTTWGLGVYLVYNPLETGANPVNDIILTICFLGGFGLMAMMGWRTRTVNGAERSGFAFRLPRALGGVSEEEEVEANVGRNYRDRVARHRDRLNNVIRGRR